MVVSPASRRRRKGFISEFATETRADLLFPCVLSLEQEGNEHVKFNIDIKVTSDPSKIFPKMAEIIE